MALIQIDGTEIDIEEDIEVALGRLAAAHDGIRRSDGSIVAPAGWMTVTDAVTGDEIFVQANRVGYLRDN